MKIQEKYFEILDDNLGSYYFNKKKNNLSTFQFFKKTFDKTCGLTFGEAYEFVENIQNELNELWNRNIISILDDVKKLSGLNVYHFWVPYTDISNEPTIVNRVGLYADTILLDDPLWRATANLQDWEAYYRFMKVFLYGFNLLELKDLIFADLDQPIVLVVPSRIHIPEYKKKFEEFVSIQRLELANTLFQKKFSSEDKLADFFIKNVKSFDDFEKLTKKDTKNQLFKENFKEDVKLKTTGHNGLYNHFGDLPLVIPKEIILGDTFFSFTTGYITYSIQQYYKAIILNSYPVFENNLALQQSNQFLEVEQQIFNKFLKEKPSKYLVGSNVLLNQDFCSFQPFSIESCTFNCFDN